MDRNSTLSKAGWVIAVGIILLIVVVGLWWRGFQEISILTLLLSFAFLLFQIYISKHFDLLEKRIEQQNQIILQASQAGFDFKQQVTKDMYEAAKELWVQVVWLARNFSALWPGADRDEKRRQEYLDHFQQFEQILMENSILLPKSIFNSAGQLVSAINTYRAGRDIREMGGEARDRDTSREGGQMMSQGSKDLNAAFNDLPRVIRNEFGLGRLPEEIIDVELELGDERGK
ncbi:MAG: hypothetical protein IIA59_06775 [Candidatus Marinimicrobia bacterium]|nr:hypothetical protein [Candidatus Neomarinimicrobiota bacterium]